MGFLEARKGHEFLVKAIRRVADDLRDIKCIIIGSGARARALERLVSVLNLTSIVELRGRRSHCEVLRTMSWCDVFVLPSWNEPFGTVYSEAMAFGKPIIGCEGEGIGEVVDDGVQGLLVKPANVDSLVAALRTVLKDHDLASRMGEASKVLATRSLTYTFVANKIIGLYRQTTSIR